MGTLRLAQFLETGWRPLSSLMPLTTVSFLLHYRVLTRTSLLSLFRFASQHAWEQEEGVWCAALVKLVCLVWCFFYSLLLMLRLSSADRGLLLHRIYVQSSTASPSRCSSLPLPAPPAIAALV